MASDLEVPSSQPLHTQLQNAPVHANNLHDPNQSGFKAAHSTETALLAVTEKLRAARSAKLSSVLILLDLSAAFDIVNQKTLLSTLRSLGICGTACEWFASYLDGRSYQVSMGNDDDQIVTLQLTPLEDTDKLEGEKNTEGQRHQGICLRRKRHERGRKPEYLEKTPEAQGEYANSTHTQRKRESNPKPWRTSQAPQNHSSAFRGTRRTLVLAGSSPGVNSRQPGPCEGEASGAAAAEDAEAKAALPPFEPFSPAEVASGSDVHLKICLVRLQSEQCERLAESRTERELRLEIRRLEIEVHKQIRLRELEMNAARDTPVPPMQSLQNAAASTASGSSGGTFDSGGRRTQVDYILCRRGNLKEISDCKVVVGESVARQHRMVVCRMTLMVCKKKRSEIEKKTKWWKLKKEECCEEFRQKLRQALGGQVVLPDDWETTAEVMREKGAGCVIWKEERR
ncbi:hypothetical protein QTP86_000864 [Hemibagrus guttatus]|nr:hypothetical protein QTP86_000864 [Hemibagrus guttatus]